MEYSESAVAWDESRERSFVHPDGHLLAAEAILAKEPPVLEVDIAMLIKGAGKLCGIEHAGEHLFWVGASQDATQHVSGAVSPVLALTMSVMMLDVVVLPPRLVGLLDFRPSAHVGKGMVPKPSLDREQRFCIILPGFTRVDALFADTQHIIKLHSHR